MQSASAVAQAATFFNAGRDTILSTRLRVAIEMHSHACHLPQAYVYDYAFIRADFYLDKWAHDSYLHRD